MTAVLAAAFREEVRQPQREVAVIQYRVVRADGVVRHDEAALNDVNKVRLRVGFQYVENSVDR